MNRRSILGVAAAGLCAAVWTYACGDGATEPPTPPPDPPRPATVAVAPATVRLTALGATEQLTAEVRDQNGNAMAGAAVSWASSAAAVATVSASGLLTAVGNGTATITATAGSASGSATVTVAQEVSGVAVSPATDTVVAGDTLRLAAEATDANGHPVVGTVVDWASSDTLVAVVDDAGLVTGIAAGEAEVTAAAAGVTGRAALSVVAPAPTTVAVIPDTVALTALGQTAQLAAEVRDQIGRVMEGVVVSWSSADATIAAVDSAGLVRAIGGGATRVTATAGEVSGTAVVTVMQSAGSVVVSPAADTVALGDTLRLAAEAFDENGHAVEGAEFTWSSSNGSVATVDASGLVRGVAEGRATIMATAESVTGTSEITVENPDRAALAALYNATDGPNWVNNENWLTDAPLREWYGVRPDASGRVVRVDLSGSWDSEAGEWVPHGLTGPIPPELGSLANLTWLHLGNNALTGPIPPELGTLANLTGLNLRYNALTGPIPTELGNLSNLETLYLYNNALTGPVPTELGILTALRYLNLGGNQLTGPVPTELGNLSNLESLSLSNNALTGPIPTELGSLTALRYLNLGWNQLTGPIPQSFLQLDRLRRFYIRNNENLCVPGSSAFIAWMRRIEHRDEDSESVFCNAVDVAVLKSLYELTGGPDWTNSVGWLADAALAEWYGVEADSLGRLVTLDLTGNGLAGRLPARLGELAHMTELRIADNAELSGRLPLSLAHLSLRALDYAGTDLCAPADASFRAWLGGIESHEGTEAECPPLSDREILEVLHDATGGPDWTNSDKWLTDAPLRDWYGVRVDNQSRVTALDLGDNNLSGPMVPELGSLTNLARLNLGGNALTGTIPPELGSLTNLTQLNLYATSLTGPLPPELGNLANLTWLSLYNSSVSGSIPPEIGNLDKLTSLNLAYNELSGSIPPEAGNLSSLTRFIFSHNNLVDAIPRELGDLSALEVLELNNNEFTGSVPPAFGRMSSLRELALAHNPGMHGALPSELTALRQLDVLVATGTGLCAPPDPGFQSWLEGVYKRRIRRCIEGDPPMAYLTQAVQSREFPVPLVAGERALLRVFPTARQATTEGIPAIRARFYLRGRETRVVDIPGKSDPIPTEVDESSLSKSGNAEIPEWVVQPGLEMVIEIDPNGTLDRSLGVAKRIPATGRLAVDVRPMPLFDLTLVPLIWMDTQDSSIVDLVGAIAADHENHEMLGDTRTLLPVSDLAVAVHEPVQTSTNNLFLLLQEISAIRAMDGATGYYMGMMTPPVTYAAGIARQPGRSSVSIPYPGIIAHELGHNLSLPHAPCGGAADPDPGYPYPDGSIGAWGYDFRNGGRLIPLSTPDLMSYCGPPDGISDYNFTNAFRFRLSDANSVGLSAPPPVAPAAVKSLLLWGGVSADSVLHLEPAFVVDAPPALPDSVGDFRVSGRTTGGRELFSLSFTMPETADGDGSSSFAFILPVRPEWEGNLASITLTGPGGSFTLDGGSDLPMAILRNPLTGQIRGILRDPPPATQTAADGRAAGEPGLEILFSRGIPSGDAWRR